MNMCSYTTAAVTVVNKSDAFSFRIEHNNPAAQTFFLFTPTFQFIMTNSRDTAPATLYVLATPIGNLEDITYRAVRILKEVDLIAAEDTRHTRKLLNHFGITTRLVAYYREKEQERGAELINQLREGTTIALVSDAGTPAISDPGAVVVRMAHEAGIRVVPVPGPSALTTAVCASGFTEGGFLFLGFPPSKKNQRRKLLASLTHLTYPAVFYEAPRRVASFLADAHQVLGQRQVLVARELTKTYEEICLSTLASLTDTPQSLTERGEFVVIIGPAEQQSKPEGENLEELLIWYRDNSDISMKDACRQIAQDLGLSRSKIYQLALDIWKK